MKYWDRGIRPTSWNTTKNLKTDIPMLCNHTCYQRCRSVFNIGGYNSAFLPFFRDFEILGGDIQVLSIFQVLTILKIWGFIQVLTKMYLNNWKYVLECIKSINDEGTLCSQITIYMFSDYTSYCWGDQGNDDWSQKHNRPLVTLTRNLKQETDVFYKIYCKSHYSVNKL